MDRGEDIAPTESKENVEEMPKVNAAIEDENGKIEDRTNPFETS